MKTITKFIYFGFASLALTCFALAVTSVASPAGSGPSLSFYSGHSGQDLTLPGQTALAVLYDQNSNDSGVGVVSQNFESAFDIYDSQGADDFSVPVGFKWKVQEVDVTGVYFNGSGPAPSVHVTFYKNSGGLPDSSNVVADFPAIVPVDNGFGSFLILLPDAAVFKPGTYWVSVQANMDFALGGEWGWETSTVTNGSPAAWQNPGNGFGTGCTSWGVESVCVAVGSGPDKMFALKGKAQVWSP